MKKKIFLSVAVFIAGLCSIIYELLISTTATYFLGDGVRQFSLIIGIYLFSMGVGAYAAKLLDDVPLRNFILMEYFLGFAGGISVPILYFFFTSVSILVFQLLCLGVIFIIGFLTGMEIPLLTFSFQNQNVKDNLSNVLSLDYVGGLVATLIFPFLILPFVGLFYASLIFGLMNIVLGLLLNRVFYKEDRKLMAGGILSALTITVLVFYAGNFMKVWEQKIYKSPIIVNEQTPYQKIVMTKRGDNVKLFINRVIQFASDDEYRYHESIVHVPFGFKPNIKKVLILGGGENLATREVVKYPGVEQIQIVDIDSTIFKLAMENKELSAINDLAPFDPRVEMIVDDAFSYLYTNADSYDLIIADLPDPASQSLARLYSKQFFGLVKRKLNPNGIFITQSGDINNSNRVCSCINNTMGAVFENNIRTFHVYIPSFGAWGFNIAFNGEEFDLSNIQLPAGLKYLDSEVVRQGMILPKDVTIVKTSINTMDNPIILQYFLDDHAKFKLNSDTNQ